MPDQPVPPPKVAPHPSPAYGSLLHAHPPVLLPIASPASAAHRTSVIPGLAASVAIMIVMAMAALALVGARQDLQEGRAVHVDRAATP